LTKEEEEKESKYGSAVDEGETWMRKKRWRINDVGR
jgi:hypothetical protein